MKITIQEFDIARRNLSEFIIRQAAIIGIDNDVLGYIAQDDAPNNFPELLEAFEHATANFEPLPVWNGASDSSVYTSPDANHAFRFWHDMLHCIECKDFTLQDEIQLGIMQTNSTIAYFGKDSLEARIMLADTTGQSLYAANNDGDYPVNQISFVFALLQSQ